MDEILKVINTWLEVEKEALNKMKGFPIVEAHHRGAVAYLTKVGLLLQRHLSRCSSGRAKCPAFEMPGTFKNVCVHCTKGVVFLPAPTRPDKAETNRDKTILDKFLKHAKSLKW